MQFGSMQHHPAPAGDNRQAPSRATGQQVYDALSTAILERRLAPATRLNKETLGRIFGVSPGTVQRALSRLAEDGAVELAANRVATVARPNARNARELLDARLLIEAQVIRLIGGRLSAEQLGELRAMIRCQRASLARSDHAGLIGAANRFHLHLAKYAGNPWLQTFLAKLLRRAALSISLSRGRAYCEATCDEHEALLEALAAGDGERAVGLMHRHLSDLFSRLRFLPAPTEDLRAAFQGKLSPVRPAPAGADAVMTPGKRRARGATETLDRVLFQP